MVCIVGGRKPEKNQNPHAENQQGFSSTQQAENRMNALPVCSSPPLLPRLHLDLQFCPNYDAPSYSSIFAEQFPDFMLKLKPQLLENARAATISHGYGSFLPEPPEFTLVNKNWKDIKAQLASVDLHTYDGYSPIRSFAPKSRLNVRRVTLLHPFDFIFYTALVLALKGGISKSRLASDVVFSYRTEKTSSKQIYAGSPSYKEFRAAATRTATLNPKWFVGVTDIADFFPRIYHHRLINALEAATPNTARDYIRVLEKMLSRFSEGTSYGIPIGPPASRLLAEAVLIDVDSTLKSYRIDFIRFVDDYVIFSEKPKDAEYGIRVLGETLFQNHGLTLQTAKTKVLSASDYLEKHLTLHSEKEANRRKLFEILGDSLYEETSYEDLNDEQKKEIDAYNLVEMLTDALSEDENVDYQEVSFILGRLSSLQKPELIGIVLENLDRLYPVANAVAAFFKEFKNLEKQQYTEIGTALLGPLLHGRETRPSEFYAIWILHVFAQDERWEHGEELLRVFRETNSDVIRRYSALALAKSGSRAQAVTIKEYLSSGSPQCRTAMLLATAKLGTDERKFFKKSLHLNDAFEKICADSHI